MTISYVQTFLFFFFFLSPVIIIFKLFHWNAIRPVSLNSVIYLLFPFYTSNKFCILIVIHFYNIWDWSVPFNPNSNKRRVIWLCVINGYMNVCGIFFVRSHYYWHNSDNQTNTFIFHSPFIIKIRTQRIQSLLFESSYSSMVFCVTGEIFFKLNNGHGFSGVKTICFLTQYWWFCKYKYRFGWYVYAFCNVNIIRRVYFLWLHEIIFLVVMEVLTEVLHTRNTKI